MFEPVYQYALVRNGDRVYRPRAYGELESDSRWSGWLVFFPVGAGRVVATERETTQNTFTALSDWAAGLSGIYLERALARALTLTPEPAVAARRADLERIAAESVTRSRGRETAADLPRATAASSSFRGGSPKKR